jgi:hypothetical protein
MHQTSYDMMSLLLSKIAFDLTPLHVGEALDCGSAMAETGLQKSYRGLVEQYGFKYTGFDAAPGKNVDKVGDIYKLTDEISYRYELIISGQTLEHLTFPLLAVQQMKEALHFGGWIILIAPWQYGVHRYPIDCWRVLEDGMKFLLEGFEKVEAGHRHNDCWGIGKKPLDYKTPWEIKRAE